MVAGQRARVADRDACRRWPSWPAGGPGAGRLRAARCCSGRQPPGRSCSGLVDQGLLAADQQAGPCARLAAGLLLEYDDLLGGLTVLAAATAGRTRTALDWTEAATTSAELITALTL